MFQEFKNTTALTALTAHGDAPTLEPVRPTDCTQKPVLFDLLYKVNDVPQKYFFAKGGV